MREALHQSVCHRVDHVQKHDGYRGRGCFCCARGLVLECHDHIDVAADELASRNSRRLLIREVPPVELDVSSLLMPQRPQFASRLSREAGT
jgi:hypothetical protein